jgi:Tol biopolymer transport system component
MLSAGSKLGPYEVSAPLGAGGMGEVYRAKDARLGREVALKVLPTEVARDADRRSRFEQEARAASALAHPNIVTVYDVGESDGSVWIAMELVEGRTIRDLLASGALPARRALEIGTQVAEGLAAAHAAGIVHRDLKPENLILSKDGFVKILDFGLAKLAERSAVAMEGPTVSAGSPGTQPGTVMGTVGYMSPEQAAGQPVDFRSDQFSLGSILYEMATGQRAFQRKTGVETLAAILREEPKAISELNPAAPAPLRWTIDRCLAKDPEERYASTRDLARDLKSLRDHLSETSTAVAASGLPARPRRGWLAPAFAALAAVAAVGAIAFARFAAPRPSGQPTFQQVAFRRGVVYGARFAPDGKTIVYSAAWEGRPAETFATQPDSPESRPLDLPGSVLLSVSSSSELAVALKRRFLFGYETVSTLARLPMNGGAPREVADEVTDAAWSPDGQQFAVTRPEGGRWQLEYPIGKVLATSPGWMDHPRISPDGKRVAFAEHPQRGDTMGRAVVLDTSGRRLYESGANNALVGLAWSPSGEEVWYTGEGLFALSPSGKSRMVLSGPGFLQLRDLSRDGRILLTRTSRRREVAGLASGETSERILSWHDWSFPSDLSNDGRTILFMEQGAATGGQTYLTYIRRTDGSPAVLLGKGRCTSLSSDGRRVLAQSTSEPPELLVLPTGAGAPHAVPTKGISWQWGTWMPDGRRAVIQGSEGGHASRLYLVDTETGDAHAFSGEGVNLYGGAVSPDGKFVAAQAADRRIMLYPTGGGDPKALPGVEPEEVVVRFASDGRSIFVCRFGTASVTVYRLDLTTGQREAWKSFGPADPAGVISVGPVLLSADGKSYVYSYRRILDDLFVVTGVR